MIDAEVIENAREELYNIFCGMSRKELDGLRYTDCCHAKFENNTLIEWIDEGASKLVFCLSVSGFNNYVFKIPFKGDFKNEMFLKKDYCELEKDLYLCSKSLGFEDLLTKTSFVGVVLGIPVYIAERVRPMTDFFDLEDFPISNLSKSVANEIFSNSDYMFADLPAKEHLEKFVEDYGEYKTYSLVDFILKHGLGDFHPGNVGIKENGKICLLDYSGFED